MSAKITSGNSFSIIDDMQLLAHCSVVVLADHAGKVDPYYLLGIVNSKVFTRYVSLTQLPQFEVKNERKSSISNAQSGKVGTTFVHALGDFEAFGED